ncbi:MAG TPA: TerB family tellurite resistance protein [Gemmatimonadales bacterium]|nr:TerB family tellurite resistance protein [Gemmatimonadales bacterium]
MLAWLATLPPAAVYAVLGLLAAVENVVPPVPADAAVLLGGFLSHRGVTSPLGVFAVVWVCNVTGALGVYWAARRYGRRFFGSARGRRLLAPGAVRVIEREYLRFGALGIFFARFLPGIRAVVPPFAGIANLPVSRIALPVMLHSALWYGGVTLVGSFLGAEWERLVGLLGSVNRTLAWIGAALVLLVAVAMRVRRRRARERVWRAVSAAIGPPDGEGIDPGAAALLVLELAYADPALTAGERELVARHLRERWGLHAPAPDDQPDAAPPLAGYRDRLVARFGRERRLALVEGMWQAAFADGAIGAAEARVLRLAGELLGLTPAEVEAAAGRLRAAGKPPAREPVR